MACCGRATGCPAERELSSELDVSRPILRAALKELEARHLVASRPGEGTYVAEILGTAFKEPMVGLVRRHPRAIADYLEFRREVEGLAPTFAARACNAGRHRHSRPHPRRDGGGARQG